MTEKQSQVKVFVPFGKGVGVYSSSYVSNIEDERVPESRVFYPLESVLNPERLSEESKMVYQILQGKDFEEAVIDDDIVCAIFSNQQDPETGEQTTCLDYRSYEDPDEADELPRRILHISGRDSFEIAVQASGLVSKGYDVHAEYRNPEDISVVLKQLLPLIKRKDYHFIANFDEGYDTYKSLGKRDVMTKISFVCFSDDFILELYHNQGVKIESESKGSMAFKNVMKYFDKFYQNAENPNVNLMIYAGPIEHRVIITDEIALLNSYMSPRPGIPMELF